VPRQEVDALVARDARWSEMNALIAGAAPFGFLGYWTNDAHSVMHLAATPRRRSAPTPQAPMRLRAA
jgi:hypothetical protein